MQIGPGLDGGVLAGDCRLVGPALSWCHSSGPFLCLKPLLRILSYMYQIAHRIPKGPGTTIVKKRLVIGEICPFLMVVYR